MKVSMKIGELLLRMQEFKQITLENDCEVLVKELGVKIKKPNLEYEDINYIIKKQAEGCKFIFDNQTQLSCANRHILYNMHNESIFAENLKIGDYIKTIFGFLKITDKQQLDIQNFYDIGIAAPHVYCDSNGIIHHNTIICAILSHKAQAYGRSIVIVPTKDLVTQTEEDYINLGLDVGVFFGDRKEYLKTHTICTWQSLESLSKKSKKEELDIDIDKFFENVACVIVDECFDSNTLILTPNGYIRICDIKVGDVVINYSFETNTFKEDVVETIYKNLTTSSSEKMFELEFDTGVKIQVTGNHRFLTQRGWVRADKLTAEDDIKSINT